MVSILAAPVLTQVPADGLGKGQEDSLGAWAPVTHMEDVDEAPGSCLWSGPTLAVAAIWEVTQQVEDLFLFLSLLFYVTFKQIHALF